MPATRDIRIGTCAWSFDDWKGVFYPQGLHSNQRLAHYARYFSSVEIDSTFYSPPSPHAAKSWMESTPDDFRFSCKMPREITHANKLRDSQELLGGFLHAIEPLRAKLSCILIQLPAYVTLKQDEHALRRFISELPQGWRYAVEFREPGWHVPRVAHLLEEHQVCWVWNDITPLDHQTEAPFEFLPVTTDFLYVRLLGDLNTKYKPDGGGRIHQYRQLMWERPQSLESWAMKIQHYEDQIRTVLLYANNHFEGFSPETSRRIAEKLGIRIELPDLEEARQGEKGTDQLELF